jgi:hypothetical protein
MFYFYFFVQNQGLLLRGRQRVAPRRRPVPAADGGTRQDAAKHSPGFLSSSKIYLEKNII